VHGIWGTRCNSERSKKRSAGGTLRTIYMTIKQYAFIIGSQNEHFRVHWAKITFSSWPRTSLGSMTTLCHYSDPLRSCLHVAHGLGERSLGTREESRDSRLALFVLSNLRFAHALAHATLFNILLNWRASNSKRFSCESLQVVVQFMSDMHTPNIHQSFAMRGREQERCTIAVALPRPQRSEESSMKLNVICNHVRGSMKLES